MEEDEINALLPDEMLRKVFSFLPPPDLKSSVLVCKRWAEVGEAPGLWSWVTFTADSINMESMAEKMGLRRLQCVTKLEIRHRTMVCEGLMQAVAIHPGLKTIQCSPSGLTQTFNPNINTDLCWVKPELLTQALSKMEDVRLTGALLMPQHLNAICTSISFEETNKIQRLDLSWIKNLALMEPLTLALAVSKLKHARLIMALPKVAPHGVEIMKALGKSSSSTTHVYMDEVDLSAVDAKMFGRNICCKLISLHLTNVELTTQQATSLFVGIGEESSCLENLWVDFNSLSSVEPFIFVQAMTALRLLSLNNTGLTSQQLEAIFDALEEPGHLQRLNLAGNNLFLVDPAKMARVNSLQEIILCLTNLTMQQVISIAEGSLEGTKLKRVRWTDEDLVNLGTEEEWERLQVLFARAASLGINIFQDTGCCTVLRDTAVHCEEISYVHVHK